MRELQYPIKRETAGHIANFFEPKVTVQSAEREERRYILAVQTRLFKYFCDSPGCDVLLARWLPLNGLKQSSLFIPVGSFVLPWRLNSGCVAELQTSRVEMPFLGILVLMLVHVSQAFPVPVDTVIVQVQQWLVVGSQRVEEQVLLNGVSLSGTSQEFQNIIKTISSDVVPPSLISVNQTSALRNHTILGSRECILEGSQMHWTDRVFYDGEVYLTLDHTGTWTAQLPQAIHLKALWDQELQYTKTGRIHLQDNCIKLMQELKLSNEESVSGIPVPQVLIPILAVLVFAGLIIISLLLSKNHGLRHPGGVLGSIIHYPKDMTEMSSEIKDDGYRTL